MFYEYIASLMVELGVFSCLYSFTCSCFCLMVLLICLRSCNLAHHIFISCCDVFFLQNSLFFVFFFLIFCVTENLEYIILLFRLLWTHQICVHAHPHSIAYLSIKVDLTCLAFALVATWTQNGLDFIVKVFKNHVASSGTLMSHQHVGFIG